MSTLWNGYESLPGIPAPTTPAPVNTFSDWKRYNAGEQWLLYRTAVSEMRRREREDMARILELEAQLDTAQAFTKINTRVTVTGETDPRLAAALLSTTRPAEKADAPAPSPVTAPGSRRAVRGRERANGWERGVCFAVMLLSVWAAWYAVFKVALPAGLKAVGAV